MMDLNFEGFGYLVMMIFGFIGSMVCLYYLLTFFERKTKGRG